MKKPIAILLSIIMIIGCMSSVAFATNYSDSLNHWAIEAIDEWSVNDVIHGYENGEFKPDADMTRAEAAQIMMNLMKLSETANISAFTDVRDDAWYADAVAACVRAGIIKGVSTTEIAPEMSITREMFFVMLARALQIAPETNCNLISDEAEISDWAKGYIYALVNAGYVKGVEVTADGCVVLPKSNITRAQVVSFIDQTICAYANEPETYNVEINGIVLVVTSGTVRFTGKQPSLVVIAAKGANIYGLPVGTKVVVLPSAQTASVNGVTVAAGTYVVPGDSGDSSNEITYEIGVNIDTPVVKGITLTAAYTSVATPSSIVNDLLNDSDVNEKIEDAYNKIVNKLTSGAEITLDGRLINVQMDADGVITIVGDDLASRINSASDKYTAKMTEVLNKACNEIGAAYYADVENVLTALYNLVNPANCFAIESGEVKIKPVSEYEELLRDYAAQIVAVYDAVLNSGMPTENAVDLANKAISKVTDKGANVDVTEALISSVYNMGTNINLANLVNQGFSISVNTSIVDNVDRLGENLMSILSDLLVQTDFGGNYTVTVGVRSI